MAKKEEGLKSEIAIRCARAAILLSSLKCSTHRCHCQDKEMEVMEDLKRELARERVRKKKMRFCSVMELLLQITLLFSIWTLSLLFFFRLL